VASSTDAGEPHPPLRGTFPKREGKGAACGPRGTSSVGLADTFPKGEGKGASKDALAAIGM